MGEFLEHPEVLWIALAFLPFALWDGLRRWSGGRGRQIASVVLRVLLLAAIVTAVGRPRLVYDDEVAHIVFVVDRSASVPDALLDDALARVEAFRSSLPPEEQAGLLLFDVNSEVVVYPGDEWLTPDTLREEPITETNLGGALQVAMGLIPHGQEGRILLFSDARPTQGDAHRAIRTAQARGVPIITVPIAPEMADPAVTGVDLLRTTINPGETLAGSVALRGGPRDTTGQLRLTLGDETVLEEAVTLVAGETLDVPFEYAPEDSLESGLARLEAEWVPDDPAADEQAGNNTLSTGINVNAEPRVLILTNNEPEVTNLSDQLASEDMDVTILSVAEFEAGDYDLEDQELVVLGNVPALIPEGDENPVPALSDEHIEELRHYVSRGGGLIVLGGDRSYELGGYGQTALRTVLPIELEPRDPEVNPEVTMIMILDNSGSMGSWAEGGTKMDLANQGAAAAMRLLRPQDTLGVMAVDDRVDWVVPLQSVSDEERMARAILGIPVGGGGIYVYTSLREAYRQMRRSDSPLRHVILFSDAADSEEQVSGIIFGWGPGPNSYDLARAMRSEGITVSVIGIGSEWDQDTQFLRNLADAGGGRFYLTSRASELETLFVEETQRLVDSVLDESAFRVRMETEHPAIEGLEFRRSPRLSGFIELQARETAEVILTHPDGFPILTTWRYGLGQVAALAVDAGPRWAGNWLDWDGYGVFWSQLSRWAIRRHEGDDTAIEVAFDESVTSMRLARRTPEGLTELEGALEATLTDESTATPRARPIGLEIVEPGLWDATLDTEPGRRYVIRVTDGSGQVFAEHAFVSPASPEFRHEEADRQWMEGVARQTGGIFDPGTLEPGPLTQQERHEPLWFFFLCGALVLMPLDAFLRRSGRDV